MDFALTGQRSDCTDEWRSERHRVANFESVMSTLLVMRLVYGRMQRRRSIYGALAMAVTSHSSTSRSSDDHLLGACNGCRGCGGVEEEEEATNPASRSVLPSEDRGRRRRRASPLVRAVQELAPELSIVVYTVDAATPESLAARALELFGIQLFRCPSVCAGFNSSSSSSSSCVAKFIHQLLLHVSLYMITIHMLVKSASSSAA